MNAFALILADEALRLANERTDGYRREQAIDRLIAGIPKPRVFGGIATAVSSLRSAMTAVDVDYPLPPLVNYPYRG